MVHDQSDGVEGETQLIMWQARGRSHPSVPSAVLVEKSRFSSLFLRSQGGVVTGGGTGAACSHSTKFRRPHPTGSTSAPNTPHAAAADHSRRSSGRGDNNTAAQMTTAEKSPSTPPPPPCDPRHPGSHTSQCHDASGAFTLSSYFEGWQEVSGVNFTPVVFIICLRTMTIFLEAPQTPDPAVHYTDVLLLPQRCVQEPKLSPIKNESKLRSVCIFLIWSDVSERSAVRPLLLTWFMVV